MPDEGYYKDQPRFERKDPLDRWSWIFIGIAGLALVWFLTIIILTSSGRLTDDELFGLTEGFWVGISTLVVIVAILGLIFVIVGRMGATSGGSYLAADLRRERRPRAPEPKATTPKRPDHTAESEPSDADKLAGEYGLTPKPVARPPARIDDPFGPDGRMLMSYTVPPNQPRGLYGDTWVTIDEDAVLNVKTLLAKTIGGTRGD